MYVYYAKPNAIFNRAVNWNWTKRYRFSFLHTVYVYQFRLITYMPSILPTFTALCCSYTCVALSEIVRIVLLLLKCVANRNRFYFNNVAFHSNECEPVGIFGQHVLFSTSVNRSVCHNYFTLFKNHELYGDECVDE